MSVYRGVVISNEDPAGKGRILLYIPDLFGNTPTNWVPPTIENAIPPSPGNTVWVLFHGNSHNKPVYIAYGQAPDFSGLVRADDVRLFNERIPVDVSVTGGIAEGAKIALETITDDNISVTNKDGATNIPSLRTLGAGAQQAASGDHTHGGSNYREVVMADGQATPTPITTEDGKDWLYAD